MSDRFVVHCPGAETTTLAGTGRSRGHQLESAGLRPLRARRLLCASDDEHRYAQREAGRMVLGQRPGLHQSLRASLPRRTLLQLGTFQRTLVLAVGTVCCRRQPALGDCRRVRTAIGKRLCSHIGRRHRHRRGDTPTVVARAERPSSRFSAVHDRTAGRRHRPAPRTEPRHQGRRLARQKRPSSLSRLQQHTRRTVGEHGVATPGPLRKDKKRDEFGIF